MGIINVNEINNNEINENIKNSLSKNENVFKAYKFFVDEIIFTTFGIYFLNKKWLLGWFLGEKISFSPFHTITEVNYKRGKLFSLSSKIIINTSSSDFFSLKIKIPKRKKEYLEKIIKIIKDEYITKGILNSKKTANAIKQQ